MEFNDAEIYCDPYAYIQRDKGYGDKRRVNKVMFQEPYETVPNFYMNNDFKKGNCECIPKPSKPKPKSNLPFNFDFKMLLPLLSKFTNGNSNLSTIFSVLGGLMNNDNESKVENFNKDDEKIPEKHETSYKNLDFSKIFSVLLENPTIFSSVMNMFSNKQKNMHSREESSDVEIKDYVRVD